MLVRPDPFRDLDRLTQQVLGTAARPAVMPMDAWREGEEFVVEFDLPGINEESLDLDIERNVVTVRAERPDIDPGREMLATERPRGRRSAGSWCSDDNLEPQDRSPLPRRRLAATHPGGREGQTPQDRDRPRQRS